MNSKIIIVALFCTLSVAYGCLMLEEKDSKLVKIASPNLSQELVDGSNPDPCFYATAAAPTEMRATPLLPLIFAVVVTAFSYMSDARWVCTPCLPEEECENEPNEFCMWGEARDSCNRRICAKGPGERCGGPLGILGHCGEGMMCKTDERCHGCSTQTFQCHP